MRKWKKILGVLLVVMVLLVSSMVGQAVAFEVKPQAFTYLRNAYVDIDYLGNGNLHVIGVTEASTNVSKIEVRVTIQRYVGSSWVDVNTITATNYNSSKAQLDNVVKVTPGYNYRLRGYHFINNGINESTITYSPYVFAY